MLKKKKNTDIIKQYQQMVQVYKFPNLINLRTGLLENIAKSVIVLIIVKTEVPGKYMILQ